VGVIDGFELGNMVGKAVGGFVAVGKVGDEDGKSVGMTDGFMLGLFVGNDVVGLNVGGNVGSGVYLILQIVHCACKFCDPTTNI